MLTRCPECETFFKITAEQLAVREGMVRCGKCMHAFNATWHLAPERGTPPEPPTRARPVPEPPATPPAPTPPAPAPQPPTAQPPARDEEIVIQGTAKPDPDLFTPQPETRDPYDTLLSELDAEPEPDEAQRGADLDDLARLLQSPADEDPPRRDTPAEPAEKPPAPDPLPDLALEPSADAQLTSFEVPPVPAPPPREPEPIEMSPQPDALQTLERARRRRLKHQQRKRGILPGAVTTLLLLLLLLAQAGYFFSTPLLEIPALRAAAEFVCVPLACRVPPRVDVEHIELLSSSVAPLGEPELGLRVSFSLVNRAAFVQPFPTVELTLTNHEGRTLARRSFPPAGYVPDTRTGLMPINVAVDARLDVTSPAAQDMGYALRVYANRPPARDALTRLRRWIRGLWQPPAGAAES